MEAPDALIPRRDMPSLFVQMVCLSSRHGLDPETSSGVEVTGAVLEEAAREFDELLPHLPKTVGSVLDIGCGLGAINIPLARHYGQPTIYLLDGEVPTMGRRGGFGPATNFGAYNYLATTEAFLAAHGVESMVLLPIGSPLPACDLVLSLRSWGWHYPVETYARQVRATGAAVVLDLRMWLLKSRRVPLWACRPERMEAEGFRHTSTITTSQKGARMAWE